MTTIMGEWDIPGVLRGDFSTIRYPEEGRIQGDMKIYGGVLGVCW